MIFVTVGSTHFDELIKNVIVLKERYPRLEIVCQIGTSNIIPDKCQWFRFKDTLVDEIEEADVIITHGGVTVLQSLAANKKIIAISNTDLADDHQTTFLSTVAEYIHIPWSNDPSDLVKLYDDLASYTFKRSELLSNDLYNELFK
jgi:beta-1,4-N-acetylglucosaminyltransferase